MARGDHIYVRRPGKYTHHGIDVGAGFVVHWSASDGTKDGASIRRTSLEEFSGGATVRVRAYGTRISREQTALRAESMVGRAGYDLLEDNCEHFATWCATGEHGSEQVQSAVSSARIVGLGVAVPSAGMSLVTTLGHGAAFSGPNLMSGLARVGGTATGGVVLIAAAAGLATAGGMCLLIPNKPSLPDHERQARRIGRHGAGAGAVAATALSFRLVGAMGVAGYSAAGLTSGLSSLGGVIGGGMAAGATIAVSIPAVTAVALGYLLYRLARSWLEGRTRRQIEGVNGLNPDFAGL